MPLDPNWHSKNNKGGLPLRLDLPDGRFAEVAVAPLSAHLPFRWAAYAPQGRVLRGSAAAIEVGQERAEDALLKLEAA